MLQVDMQISNHSHQWHHSTITIKRCVLFYIPHSGSLSFVFPFFLSFISSKKPKQFISFIFLLFFLSFYYFFFVAVVVVLLITIKRIPVSRFGVWRETMGHSARYDDRMVKSHGEFSSFRPCCLSVPVNASVRPRLPHLFNFIIYFSSLSLSLSLSLACYSVAAVVVVMFSFDLGEVRKGEGGRRRMESWKLEEEEEEGGPTVSLLRKKHSSHSYLASGYTSTA